MNFRKSSRRGNKSIIKKLAGDEITELSYGDDLGSHRLVKIPQQFTERSQPFHQLPIDMPSDIQGWKIIRQPLIEYMEEMKLKRLAPSGVTIQKHCDQTPRLSDISLVL